MQCAHTDGSVNESPFYPTTAFFISSVSSKQPRGLCDLMCTPIEVVLDLKDIALYNGVVIKDSESLQYWGKNQVEEIKKKKKKKNPLHLYFSFLSLAAAVQLLQALWSGHPWYLASVPATSSTSTCSSVVALIRKASHNWIYCVVLPLLLYVKGPRKSEWTRRRRRGRNETKAAQRDVVRKRGTKLYNYRERTRVAAQPDAFAGCSPPPGCAVRCTFCLYRTFH